MHSVLFLLSTRLNQSTSGNYDVVSIKGVDPKKKMLYYLSCEVSPMERNLYNSEFNGKDEVIAALAGHERASAHPDFFKAGIVASATAKHLNYDNIYTERYMGLKEENAKGYDMKSRIFLYNEYLDFFENHLK